MLAIPVLAEGSQHLTSLDVREHASEGTVLTKFAGQLIGADEHRDDGVGPALDQLLSLLEVASRHPVFAVDGLPAAQVRPRRVEHGRGVNHEVAQKRTVQRQALLLLTRRQRRDHALDVGTSDPSVGAGAGAGQFATIAQSTTC